MDSISLKNKRILVTGGNGYLGSFLVKALQKLGAEVFVIDIRLKDTPNEFLIDITNLDLVKYVVNKIRPNIVFHLAAILNRERDFTDHEKIVHVNYNGTMNMLLALKEYGKCENFIFTSTSEIYGDSEAPFKETLLPKPASPYSLSKVFAENGIKTFSEIYKFPYTILRLFNFYGNDMPKSFFMPQLIHSLKNDKSFKMTLGEQARDFLYVEDVIQGLILAATKEKAKQQTFNVCCGKGITLQELVLDCKEALQSDCNIDFGAFPYRENEIWNMVGDNTKITEMLGFKPKYELKSTVKKIYNDSSNPLPKINIQLCRDLRYNISTNS
jgi:nucleoside-diphosphate-sugar epimerase